MGVGAGAFTYVSRFAIAMSAKAGGRLIIISGPSGAGKSTVVRRLIHDCPLPLCLSVSATTRPPRAGERNGEDYYFLSRETFEQYRTEGRFLECKEVFGGGDWYGTLRSEVERGLAEGRWVILEIDVEGAKAVLEQHPEVITIFLHPGSMEELERRLRKRATETEASMQRRLQAAQREMASQHLYRHIVVNTTQEQAAREICAILRTYENKGDV